MSIACGVAQRVSDVLGHPLAIVAFPVLCGLWFVAGGSMEALTLALSIFAISTTQLILLAQDTDTKAVHAKLDTVIHGVPDADDTLAGIERANGPHP